MRLFLIVTVQLFIPISLLGGFESFTVEHGLSHNTINAIAQDSAGYLWIATPDGVSKYDGYSFTQYRHDYSDTTTLPANFVTTLYVDSKGRVWVGTFSGLCRYEPGADGFTRFRFPKPAAGEFPNYTVHAITESPGDATLVATSLGVFEADRVASVLHKPDFPPELTRVVTAVPVTGFSVERNMVWMATAGSGLIGFDPAKRMFRHIKQRPDGPLSGGNVASLVSGSSANGMRTLWLITAKGELNEVTLGADEMQARVAQIPNSPVPPTAFATMMQDSRGMLWIRTRGFGVLEVKPSPDGLQVVSHHYHVAGDSRTLTGNLVTGLLEDRWGNIWIGTGNGLNKFTQRQRHIKHYRPPVPSGKEENANAFRNVTAMFLDTKGNTWIGNAAGQLFRFNSDETSGREFLPYPVPTILKGFAVSSIHEVESEPGILWIGTSGHGVFRLDTRSGGWKQFAHSSSQPASLSSNQVNAIEDDGIGRLWIGTNVGLNSLDVRSQTVVRYLRDHRPPSFRDSSQLLTDAVWTITKDRTASKPTLWIGTIGGWMSRFDVESRTFSHFADSTVPSVNNRSITTFHQDSLGVLWIGSYSGGVKRLDASQKWVDDFTMKDGLPNNMIQGIVQDARGNLWLSTNNGICRFAPSTGNALLLDINDGLQGTQFHRGVCLKDGKGYILFGGTNGLNRFHPDSIDIQQEPPAIVLSSFSVLGTRFPLPGREVTLDYSENFLTFEFLALELTKPRKSTYAYRLDGVDREWVQAGTRRIASYAHLGPGRYTLHVKASNADGVWSAGDLSLVILIRPPFWRTWWFLFGCIVLIAGLTVLLYRIKTKSLIRRELEIERIREEERESVRIKTARDFHDEMGHRLTRITMLSETASRKLINSPTEVKDLLDAIRDNANHLFNGTRDFIWSLDARNDSLFDFAARLKDFGDELFYKTGVAFQAHGISEHFHSIRLPMEVRRQLILIFKEAMTNIVRHASCSLVRLEFAMEEQTLCVSLSDDGVGFGSGEDDAGTGMSNMRARANKIAGVIDISSAPGKGTCVSFRIPFHSV